MALSIVYSRHFTIEEMRRQVCNFFYPYYDKTQAEMADNCLCLANLARSRKGNRQLNKQKDGHGHCLISRSHGNVDMVSSKSPLNSNETNFWNLYNRTKPMTKFLCINVVNINYSI